MNTIPEEDRPMLCKNCHEPIVDESDEEDPEVEWTHPPTFYATFSWRCRDDSGRHAEPKED